MNKIQLIIAKYTMAQQSRALEDLLLKGLVPERTKFPPFPELLEKYLLENGYTLSVKSPYGVGCTVSKPDAIGGYIHHFIPMKPEADRYLDHMESIVLDVAKREKMNPIGVLGGIFAMHP